MVRWITYIIFSKAFTPCLIKISQISYAPNQPCVGRPDRSSPTLGLNLILLVWRISLYTAMNPFSCPRSQAFSCKPPLVSGLFLTTRLIIMSQQKPGFFFQTKYTLTHRKTKNECILIQCIFRFSLRKSKLGLNPCRIWGEAIKPGVKSSLF